MKPYTRSIVELFDGKKRYLIPLYQRQYAWRVSPQLELLWEDIERAVQRLTTDRASLSPHFMGAIVISQIKTFGKQVQAYEIIDGQQRLTTFQLLLTALRDVAQANGSKYGNELQKYLLNDGVMESPAVEQFKLWPSLTDRRSFVSLIDPAADLDQVSQKPLDEDGFVRRSVAAYSYFRAQVETHVTSEGAFDEDRLETLFEALKEGLAIVSIELEGGDDPQTIFETLNSRGVDLTPGDLMRNFIFQRAKGMGQAEGSLLVDQLYEKHWLPLDRAFWSQHAARGRQTRQRLDWMLTDHLSMHQADLVSVESLFENYRRWILNERPFSGVGAELESISATAAVETRLFNQDRSDCVGAFGRFAEAFDVSTAMPLVVFLATEAGPEADLAAALDVLESYILRRDICGLTTKNYNRLFVGIIQRLRTTEGSTVEKLITYLSSLQSDIDRWPDDAEWRKGWLGRDQYKGARQPRLRYLLEGVEQKKRSSLNEDIEIKSALTVEHIMPQKWEANWPIPGFGHLQEGDVDVDYLSAHMARDGAINKLGNLTLLTQALNTTVSNGPFSVKMPAVRAHSSLALNRELNGLDHWDEASITERGNSLFQTALSIWSGPERPDDFPTGISPVGSAGLKSGLPAEGSVCRFVYSGKEYRGRIAGEALHVDGLGGTHASFSSASRAVTQTNRNGWMDWYVQTPENAGWVLADDWRRS